MPPPRTRLSGFVGQETMDIGSGSFLAALPARNWEANSRCLTALFSRLWFCDSSFFNCFFTLLQLLLAHSCPHEMTLLCYHLPNSAFWSPTLPSGRRLQWPWEAIFPFLQLAVHPMPIICQLVRNKFAARDHSNSFAHKYIRFFKMAGETKQTFFS